MEMLNNYKSILNQAIIKYTISTGIVGEEPFQKLFNKVRDNAKKTLDEKNRQTQVRLYNKCGKVGEEKNLGK